MTSMPPLSSFDSSLHANPDVIDALNVIPDSDQALTNELTRLAGHINAAHYRFLKLLAALIDRKAWGGDSGMKTPAHWLNYYCGIDLGAAREKVRVAKALQSLPQIDEAFATGAISYSKVRAMTRSATPDNEAVYLNVARHGTAQHVETLVRQHRRVQRLDRAAGNADKPQQDNQDDSQYQSALSTQPAQPTQHQSRELSWYFDEDGMLVMKGRFAAEEGAVLIKALEAALDSLSQNSLSQNSLSQNSLSQNSLSQNSLPQNSLANDRAHVTDVSAETFSPANPDSTFPRKRETGASASSSANPATSPDVSAETSPPQDPESTFPQKRADALLLVTEHFLATRPQGSEQEPQHLANADKYQVLIHLDAGSALTSRFFDQSACLDDGPPLPDATSKRLSCDASVVPVLRDDSGNVLNIGRKSRTVPPAIRRALKIRDRGCRHPGCTQTRHVDAHHIQHWCDGGETSLDNLVLLCRFHHRMLHEGGFSIERGTEGGKEIRFFDGNGKQIRAAMWPQFAAPVSGRDGRIGVEEENARFGLNIDAHTAVTRWQGEQMDYRMAIDALV